MNDEIIYYIDKVSKLEKKLNKVLDILGDPSINICPNEFVLDNKSSLCPEHINCRRCWDEGLDSLKEMK